MAQNSMSGGAPGEPVVALPGTGAQRLVFLACRLNKYAYQMFSAAVDERGDGAAVDYVESSALQGKTIVGEVLNRRREIQLAIEPGLYGVLIGGQHVGEMAGLQRAQMRVHDFRGDDGLIIFRAQGRDRCASRHRSATK